MCVWCRVRTQPRRAFFFFYAALLNLMYFSTRLGYWPLRCINKIAWQAIFWKKHVSGTWYAWFSVTFCVEHDLSWTSTVKWLKIEPARALLIHTFMSSINVHVLCHAYVFCLYSSRSPFVCHYVLQVCNLDTWLCRKTDLHTLRSIIYCLK